MKARPWVLVAAGAIGLTALVVGSQRDVDRSPASTPSSADEVTPTPAPNPDGAEVFRFRLRHQSRVEVLGQVARSGSPPVTLETKVHFEGHFALWPMGVDGDRRLVQFGFLELPRHELLINGEAVFATEALVREELLPHRAVLALEAGGRPVELRIAPGSAPPFERMVQLVVGELQYAVGPGEEWSASELSALGQVDVAYRASPVPGDGRRLEKRRTRYRTLRPLEQRDGLSPAEVQARAELELDGAGHLLHFEGAEEVQVARGGVRVLEWRMEAEAHRADRPAPRARSLASFNRKQAFGEVTVSERTEAQHLAQRIGDMTAEKMFADLGRFGAGGHMPDHNAWCWKVTGLLRRDPALAAALGERFWARELGSPGRGLIVDLLAGAGTSEAQVVLRAILARKEELEPKEWRRHLQALGQLTRPTAETLEFVVQSYQRGEGTDRWASALAVGAVVNHRLESADDPQAKEAADRLLRDLESSQDNEVRSRLLGALGNAGVPAHLPRLLALRSDPSPNVRARMAYALRKQDAPEARAALAEMVGDPNSGVAIQAINTLDRLTIGDPEISAVHAQMMAGRIPPEAFAGVVSAFNRHTQHPLVREIFQRIIAHPQTFNELRARCRTLLSG